jgi:hypothetical protein
MDGASLAILEALIIMGMVLTYLVYDLRKTRREIREAKAAEDRERRSADPIPAEASETAPETAPKGR